MNKGIQCSGFGLRYRFVDDLLAEGKAPGGLKHAIPKVTVQHTHGTQHVEAYTETLDSSADESSHQIVDKEDIRSTKPTMLSNPTVATFTENAHQTMGTRLEIVNQSMIQSPPAPNSCRMKIPDTITDKNSCLLRCCKVTTLSKACKYADCWSLRSNSTEARRCGW